MKGDFSRIRFDPAQQFTAVLKQQGRVSLDADDNEQSAILAHLRETSGIDIIGPSGGPIGDAGFAIDVTPTQVTIGAGRYYVDGILVENPAPLDFNLQPHSLDSRYTAQQLLAAVSSGAGLVTAHLQLEVWQRLVTRLDDPCLQEPALGQADTTARLQTVWRVTGALQNLSPNAVVRTNLTLLEARTFNHLDATATTAASQASATQAAVPTAPPVCCQAITNPALTTRTGLLTATTSQSGADCGCEPVSSAGYQGLENQLYRVEIHTAGTLTTATFKWSRENASVVTQITSYSGATLNTSGLGPDANLGFQPGQWVELTDDSNLFGETPNSPGTLYQILSVNPSTLQVTLTTPVVGIDATRNARMRRWDQTAASATSHGIPVSHTPTLLENGIEVSFSKGQYQAGDFWTIPARTATGQIEWPPCGSDGNLFQPGHFTRIHVVPLACVHLRSANIVTTRAGAQGSLYLVEDCRLLFPPLTSLASNVPPPALHVTATSWLNDEVITIDTFLRAGFSVTFDQPPTNPWDGGNFRVTMEVPQQAFAITNRQNLAILEALSPLIRALPATTLFQRSKLALDPPLGFTVSGNQVSWTLPPAANATGLAALAPTYLAQYLYGVWNNLLAPNGFNGFGRLRVKLLGSAVYAASATGNAYLDGVAFGQTASRASDQLDCVHLTLPSGNSLKASDFESWFYLAPSITVTSAIIQVLVGATVQPTNAVTVTVNANGAKTGLTYPAPVGTQGAAQTVTAVQAIITLSYKAVSPATVSLTLTGTGAGSVVTIPATVTVPAGQSSITVPITIQTSPGISPTGAANVDTVTLTAAATDFQSTPPAPNPPTLAITGGAPPPIIIR